MNGWMDNETEKWTGGWAWKRRMGSAHQGLDGVSGRAGWGGRGWCWFGGARGWGGDGASLRAASWCAVAMRWMTGEKDGEMDGGED
jgi:hypothetical protein